MKQEYKLFLSRCGMNWRRDVCSNEDVIWHCLIDVQAPASIFETIYAAIQSDERAQRLSRDPGAVGMVVRYTLLHRTLDHFWHQLMRVRSIASSQRLPMPPMFDAVKMRFAIHPSDLLMPAQEWHSLRNKLLQPVGTFNHRSH